MRSTSKAVFIALLATFTASAQKPVGVSGFVGNYIDYWGLGTANHTVDGDTYLFQAWAANSMLSFFPDPTGLPVVGVINDGNIGGCGGNVELIQLSKLPGPFTTPTTSNTTITPYTNCLTSFGTSPGDVSTWGGHLTYGDASSEGTWKGVVMAFRNNILLAPFYRQNSPGTAFGDSTLMLSPDAGQTWIDYSRYTAYTVTLATCTGTTATLTALNSLAGNEKIFVHDVGAGYNGKATLTGATGTTVQYTVATCPGTGPTSGNFGLLSASGSGPAYTPGSTMWPVSGGKNPMAVQMIVNYGQDGNYPAGIEAVCDPTAWVCGLAKDFTQPTAPLVAYRVPLGREMTPASYLYYTCPGYNAYWPVADTVCDGNQAAAWTSAKSSATTMLNLPYTGNNNRPTGCTAVAFLPSHGSYVLSCLTWGYPERHAYYWGPHLWGPWYPFWDGPCTNGNPVCDPIFQVMMGYGQNVISTTPPLAQIRIASGSSGGPYAAGGTPKFWTVEVNGGRVPFTGISRRADYLGSGGQLNMGHRFGSGNEAGTISRRGLAVTGGAYSLDWWVDFWDHGGFTGATNRPYFRDVLSGGTKYLTPCEIDGAYSGCNFTHGMVLASNGVTLPSTGYSTRIQSSFTDTVLPGNTSWTFAGVFNIANTTSSSPLPILSEPPSGGNTNTMVNVYVSSRSTGDLCVEWGGKFTSTPTAPTSICTAGGTILAGTWYFVAVSAKANGSGFPTVTMYVGNAGTIAEYGGVNMATSANGTTGNGLTKVCTGAGCSATPAVIAGLLYFGLAVDGTSAEFGGTFGELGMFSGVVPSHVIREIYRTLRADWARVGRGAL